MDKCKIDENFFLIIYADDNNKLKIDKKLLNEMKKHIFLYEKKNFLMKK